MKGYKYVRDAREVINDRISLYSTSSKVSLSGIKALRRIYDVNEPILSTDNIDQDVKDVNVFDCQVLDTDGKGNFIDSQGRKIILKGINVDGAAKLPVEPYLPTYKGNADDGNDIFFDGDNVSFVGRPFPLEEAASHFTRIKSWGYNTIRYIITWEAIEHKGPGIYDDDFIEYTSQIIKIVHEIGGLYVFFDVHQDVWSRFSGGSGAPLWTLYAAGLQPKRFSATEAALLHNERRYQSSKEDPLNPDDFPKMIWPTNYKRLASLVMFTMFFSGKNYFPHLELNGVNIQDYLQDKFFNCVEYFWESIIKKNQIMIDDGTILGFETMNEPNCGLMGHPHLGYIPASQQLRVGTTPTIYQSFKLGMGIACEVEDYKITISGPQKSGSEIVDPKGAKAWMTIEEAKIIDSHYGWKRSDKWIIGDCIFKQVGIWSYDKIHFKTFHELPIEQKLEEANKSCELINPHFFSKFSPSHNFKMYSGMKPKVIDMEFFTNNNFVDYIIRYKHIIRKHAPDVFFLLQPPVLEIPPNLKTDPRNIIDNKTVYCPHYYDGMSLMFKSWNNKYNVDTLGIMRNRYLNPILGIVFGERAIRNCLRKQFIEIRKECEDYLGPIPVLMSETGMPFDMDGKRAYKDGRYSSQTYALDALSYALEGANMSHTYWCYTSVNCHKWGDRWNNEDFSFWSPDDRNLTFNDDNLMGDFLNSTISTTAGLIKTAHSRRINNKVKGIKSKLKKEGNAVDIEEVEQAVEELDLSDDSSDNDLDDARSLQDSSLICWTADNVRYRHTKRCFPSPDGVRAPGAIMRPYAVATEGEIVATEFDLRTVKFSLTVSLSKGETSRNPTIIYVPSWHYPNLSYHDIYLTSGFVKYNEKAEYLEWYHYDIDERSGSVESESSTLVNEPLNRDETIIIKNNTGTLDTINDSKTKTTAGCIIS
ncbi:ergosteryl-beta-glucosidase [[Candida] jaroonii]|uniref:Ergosteryl-beta-glucosidase n=1 Tax=[Candida] jaroonii TaxID=467808 RepID=A0ACA9XZX7_9ASCO|nr:ergosteryl-beta-glucosidase [[Candida] jaroonii]